jgi:hypothetical protein
MQIERKLAVSGGNHAKRRNLGPFGEQKSNRAAYGREQNAFGEHLAN